MESLRAEKNAEIAALKREKDYEIAAQQDKIDNLTTRLERIEKLFSNQ